MGLLQRRKKHEEEPESLEQRENQAQKPLTTKEVMEGGGRKEEATPGEGILTSTGEDRDAATG